VFYLRDAERIVICNTNPGFEKTNPWVINLRANKMAEVQIGMDHYRCVAHEADELEIERYWSELITVWPAYQHHFARSGQRTVFILDCVEQL
jgi:deazaflavin-dependent oxidoreductase (nitroreductase family)